MEKKFRIFRRFLIFPDETARPTRSFHKDKLLIDVGRVLLRHAGPNLKIRTFEFVGVRGDPAVPGRIRLRFRILRKNPCLEIQVQKFQTKTQKNALFWFLFFYGRTVRRTSFLSEVRLSISVGSIEPRRRGSAQDFPIVTFRGLSSNPESEIFFG